MAGKRMYSLRLSEDIITVIEEQSGDSFTAKFENLVRRAYLDLPDAVSQLEAVDIMISEKKALSVDLYSQLMKMKSLASSISSKLDSCASVLPGLSSALDDIVNSTSEVLHHA